MNGFEDISGGGSVWAHVVAFLSFGLAALLSYSFTPVAIRIARSYGLEDKPVLFRLAHANGWTWTA